MLRLNFITALHKQEIINEEDYKALVSYVNTHRRSEMQGIMDMGLMERIEVLKAVAKRYSIKEVSLRQLPIIENPIPEITSEKLYDLGVVPFEVSNEDKSIKIALSDPTDTAALEVIGAMTGKKVLPYLALSHDINYYIEQIFSDNEETSAGDKSEVDIILLVQKWLSQAVRSNASDIHIEGIPDKLRIRFRIDGVLREYEQCPIEWMDGVMSRLKILSAMDIAQRRIPQDGKFTETIDRNEYDFRASIIPTVLGEKCVLRIAPKRIVFTTKQQLGLNKDDLEKFDRIFAKEHGMVLVTGPTGCGKTTTLYSVLSELSSIEKNTVTVEDPVEITLSGINQVQASSKKGMGFTNALRSILRQDPDIIMIGEIRDVETAKMAIQASVTGHLVLSTLHTNSATNTINRLVNMGVDKYLVSDALIGVISQRLLRKLCPHCKKIVEMSTQQAEHMGVGEGSEMCAAVGCERCRETGYLGRTSVFEILELDDHMRKIINKEDFDTQDLQAYALSQGMRTLSQGAKRLVIEGITSYEEGLKIQVDKDTAWEQ